MAEHVQAVQHEQAARNDIVEIPNEFEILGYFSVSVIVHSFCVLRILFEFKIT